MAIKKFCVSFFLLVFVVALTGCSTSQGTNDSSSSMSHDMNRDHDQHAMSSDRDVPQDLVATMNPEFKKGSKVTLKTDHMSGMMNAKGTVAGVYTTNVYTVTYHPTNGGKVVRNHKWVIQQELQTHNKGLLKTGTKVNLNASHMPGMMGAEATIDSAKQTNIYMVNYTDTKTGKVIKSHKWVTEDELISR
ncbi:YdhK family protein [Sporolactobacillus pectinivorans]|uniref:YdhK family protein n=1 Tax=Sporolactobacillus pectinivorans TaxID=1591408 RepID=UPI000C26AB4A|nr:YdhK family protein [Sporolactobacillus pectinivorans]